MKTFLTIWVTAVMMVPELICGNMGLALGFPVFAAVYFAVAFSPAYGIPAAGFSGLLLDILYARSFFIGPFIYMAITFAAMHTAGRMHRHQPEAPMLSGAVCGILIFIANCCRAWISGETAPGPNLFNMAVFQLIGGTIFMLLMTLLFDAVNKRCNLSRFCPLNSKRGLPGGGDR